MLYHLYRLQGFRLTGADDLEAADDGEAARLARVRAGSDAAELWRGNRRIRTIPPLAGTRT